MDRTTFGAHPIENAPTAVSMMSVTDQLSELIRTSFPTDPLPRAFWIDGTEQPAGDIPDELAKRLAFRRWVEVALDDWRMIGIPPWVARSYLHPDAFRYYLASLLVVVLGDTGYLNWALEALLPSGQMRRTDRPEWINFGDGFSEQKREAIRSYLKVSERCLETRSTLSSNISSTNWKQSGAEFDGRPRTATHAYRAATSVKEMTALSHFLNLDLVLKSDSDFSAIIEHLDQSVFVLAHDKFQGQFLLNLEISSQDRNDPKSCTQQFLMLIESFPDAARVLWDGCTSRTFSYGFRGGCDYPALDTTITADLLLRIARLGADIGITVYPYRPDEETSKLPRIDAV
jgi:hypothetical protein